MAEIYSKSTTVGNEKCVILNFREGLRYPFKIEDWTHIKVGIAWSYTAANANDNMDGFGTPTITVNSDKDRMYFGLKKYSLNFPGPQSGEYFLGLQTYGTTTYIGFPNAVFNPSNEHGTSPTFGVHHPDGTASGDVQAYFGLTAGNTSSGPSAFCGLTCLDLTILNKGQSNQQIRFKYSRQTSGTGNNLYITDTSKTAIESAMNTANYVNAGDLPFNLNGIPYELPDSFFVYIPLGALRCRISALNVIRLG